MKTDLCPVRTVPEAYCPAGVGGPLLADMPCSCRKPAGVAQGRYTPENSVR